MEEWREIPGFDGRYAISNQGSVKRLKPRKMGHRYDPKTAIVKSYITRQGYVRLALNVDGKSVLFYVHRLMGLAFLGNPPTARHTINHKDGIRTNNVPENIDWATYSENQQHSMDNLDSKNRHSEGHWNAKLTSKEVIEIRHRYANGEQQKAMAAEYGISRATMCWIVNDKAWMHIDNS